MREPKSTGVECNLTRAAYAYDTKDGGKTGRVTVFSEPEPDVGDYLILRNGDTAARYKVLAVRSAYNVDPGPMWFADLRHAPSTRP